MVYHCPEHITVNTWHVAGENEQPPRGTAVKQCFQSSQWTAITMLVLYDVQSKEGISPGIGMAGTDYNLFDKWTEHVDSLIDESLTIGSKQCLVAAKSTAAPSCEYSTI